ncbi:DUF4138 domain-containing protein [Chryseobacterium oncorhynchi]|uniref:DUF4138 domain-containing protein n=1 Tax=Chryseobacterium oncorhynchi TaxID=741074 RepID=A0A316WCN5_9FLAO|nr:DUF4138 domain-containing protein [Chryseobacterium oncorhynchi]PWN59191.1 hypothetical protein C1638_021530 [Chryseobacterium oncorhynchi]
MRKIAISIFLVGSILCYSQHTKKRIYKKPVKKTSVKKKSTTNVTASTAVPFEEQKQVAEVKPEVLQEPVKEEPKAPVITEKPDYEKTAEKILKKKGWINNRNSALVRGVEGFVKGVYSANGKIFVMLEISNRSNINYDIQNISFITSPLKKKGVDFDTEEKIFLPIYSNQPETIAKKSTQKLVFVFDKFTINENKTLFAIVDENEGERSLKLEVKPTYILSAEYVN